MWNVWIKGLNATMFTWLVMVTRNMMNLIVMVMLLCMMMKLNMMMLLMMMMMLNMMTIRISLTLRGKEGTGKRLGKLCSTGLSLWWPVYDHDDRYDDNDYNGDDDDNGLKIVLS